mmetsp:Transcript_8257/g.17025  ORF Transcript_8257/g.17025 Transcript_8257/m.17025 type:complete len:85 (+) Transcript_8257:28-282(+)
MLTDAGGTMRLAQAQMPMASAARRAKAEKIRAAMAALYDQAQALTQQLPSDQVNPAMRHLRPVFAALDEAFMHHDDAKQAAAAA